MALTEFQERILRAIAGNRSPNSMFAGGAVLNRNSSRLSDDLDIEHRSVEAVADAFRRDVAVLREMGCEVAETSRSNPGRGFAQVVVALDTSSVLVDWTVDSAVRFFPAIADEKFGWRLHDADLAINKILAMAGRREPRDFHDIVRLHRDGMAIAALAWAAPAKDAGFTPELILDEIIRNSVFPPGRLKAEIRGGTDVDPVAMKLTLLAGVAEARDLFPRLPADQVGHLYLDGQGQVCRPDPEGVRSGNLVLQGASLGGAWPAVDTKGHPAQP